MDNIFPHLEPHIARFERDAAPILRQRAQEARAIVMDDILPRVKPHISNLQQQIGSVFKQASRKQPGQSEESLADVPGKEEMARQEEIVEAPPVIDTTSTVGATLSPEEDAKLTRDETKRGKEGIVTEPKTETKQEASPKEILVEEVPAKEETAPQEKAVEDPPVNDLTSTDDTELLPDDAELSKDATGRGKEGSATERNSDAKQDAPEKESLVEEEVSAKEVIAPKGDVVEDLPGIDATSKVGAIFSSEEATKLTEDKAEKAKEEIATELKTEAKQAAFEEEVPVEEVAPPKEEIVPQEKKVEDSPVTDATSTGGAKISLGDGTKSTEGETESGKEEIATGRKTGAKQYASEKEVQVEEVRAKDEIAPEETKFDDPVFRRMSGKIRWTRCRNLANRGDRGSSRRRHGTCCRTNTPSFPCPSILLFSIIELVVE